MTPGDVEPIRTQDAAALVGRSPSTIRNWIEDDWIRVVGISGRQRLVDRGDVLRVDAVLAAGGRPAPVAMPSRPGQMIYLVVMDRGGLFGIYHDADPAYQQARAIRGVVAELPVMADYRPGVW